MLAILGMGLLALSSCSQTDAPSDQVQQAADTIIDAAQGDQPAKLAAGPLAPRDECREMDGAAAFRRQLQAAVAARDTDGLVRLAASDVKLDFGGGNGIEELRDRLRSGGLWPELQAIMTMGCAANGEGGITIPWYFEQTLKDIDPAAGMIVTGENVPIFATQDAGKDKGSRPVGTISWDAVSLVGGLEPGAAYQQVKLPNGQVGFIATDRLRSVLGYRLTAISRNGQWKIISLVAGD